MLRATGPRTLRKYMLPCSVKVRENAFEQVAYLFNYSDRLKMWRDILHLIAAVQINDDIREPTRLAGCGKELNGPRASLCKFRDYFNGFVLYNVCELSFRWINRTDLK